MDVSLLPAESLLVAPDQRLRSGTQGLCLSVSTSTHDKAADKSLTNQTEERTVGDCKAYCKAYCKGL